MAETLSNIQAIAETCACAHIRQVARLVTQRYDAALRPHGLTAGRFTLLVALAGNQEFSVSDLAAAVGMERTTLTRNLRPLIERGLADEASGEDRRRRVIRITAAGQALVAAAIPAWQQAQDRVAGRLGKKKLDWLTGPLLEVLK